MPRMHLGTREASVGPGRLAECLFQEATWKAPTQTAAPCCLKELELGTEIVNVK